MSNQRLLTEYEIESILSFIKPQDGIPIDTAMSVVNANKHLLREQLKTQLIYPQMIPDLKKMIEQQYITTKVQAGESVGVIGAQSIGEKQTQTTLNSVEWNEKLLYEIDGRTLVEPIGQMIDRMIKNNNKGIHYIPENRTEYMELPDGFKVPSCDEDGNMNWYKIEAITRHLPVGDLVKVRTYTGREVTATQSKSFLVWNGNKFVATKGCDIKIGDIVPVTKQIGRSCIVTEFDLRNIFSPQEYIYTDEIIKARKCPHSLWGKQNGSIFTLPYNRKDICFGKRKNYFMSCEPGLIYTYKANELVSHIPSKIKLDNNFGFFMGIYLAEGWVTNTFLGIRNNNENIRRRVTDYCDRYGVTHHLVTYRGKNVHRGISNYLKIHSVLLTRLFKKLCGTGSDKKKIPEFVYGAPDEFLRGLIDGYFSGDGTVSLKDGSVVVTSASQDLLIGISTLLSYFGIYCHLSSWQIDKNNIESQNIKRTYSIQISNGFAKIFAKMFKLTEQTKQDRLENVTLKKKYRYMFGKSQELFPERNVYFDKVISVEYVNSEHKFVYDLTVETTRNFQMWNGLNLRDTFHKAGSGEKTVTTGVPRVEELLNATKEPKTINCVVFMKDKHNSIAELRDTIGHQVVEITFAKISKSYHIIMNKKPEKWYNAFQVIYGDEYTKYTDCISLKIDMDILYEYKLDMEMISKIISERYSDMVCVFSPDNIGQLDVFVDTSNIDLPENRLVFINSNNAREIYLEEVVQPILYKITICGIPGITNIFFNDNQNSFETEGSNFQQILGLPFIDPNKTVSNDVWDIYYTLGIEAAREFLIEEFMRIMAGINRCHIQLLCEKMTYGGTISSISRYTMRNEEGGPMGKASFEETMDNFLKAGLYGQEEETRGVSASIICGKIANIGTGMCEIKMDIKNLPKHVPILKEITEKKQDNLKPIILPKDRDVPFEKMKTKIRKKEKSKSKEKDSDLDNEVIQQMTYLEL